MKKIILDLETTNLSPFKAEILEICVLFVEDDVVIREFCDYIKFEKNYNELDESTLLSIHFNKIYSQEDLDMHNKKARNRRNVISDLLCKVQDFGVGISISGWNNACYDNIVLRRALEELGYNYLDYFDYHSRDIMCQLQPFYEKYFKNKFRLKLQDVHQNLIGSFSDEDFHIAKNDCYATLDIDMWIERYFHSSRRGIRCSGIIFIDGKLVLIGQKNKFGKEVYLFPGGGVEHKESPKDCVKREIKEEIGLDVEVLNLMYYNTVSSSWDDSLNMFYGCKVIGGDLKIPKEEEKLTEIKLIESEEELNQLRFFPEELKNKIFESKKETYSVDLGVELYKLKK